MYIVALLLLALVGCTTVTSDRVPDGLWYAKSEEPDQFHYHVYVLFLDDSHFTWWRTKETYDVVMKRWAYYTHDHPGVKILTNYTREGDQLTGERRISDKGGPSMKANTFIQTFTGRFNGDALDMTVEAHTTYDDGPPSPTVVVRWPLRHLSHPPVE
ncbi:hypothetical protein [Pseudomonas arsenicoxydans]|nr:hypothetical protein [Pseudomonas arsenicoxydans]